MKQSPDMQRLEEILRSSSLVAGGFMGDDPRSVTEIIDADAAELFGLGVALEKLAARMAEITDAAKEGLGSWVDIDAQRRAQIDEARGRVACPWAHGQRFRKRVTTVMLIDSGQTIRWSDLSLHLIADHGFFQGKDSFFRTEPANLVRMLF